ncbi:MAG: hypothetical protein J2P48_01055 [Alphaproteobacteria bacterium]|nr:hypothetical protein [Alphaproteobacteria bacterium]
MPLASLGDVFGYRRIYAIGLAVFTRPVSSGLAFALLIGGINGIGHRQTAGFVALELIGAAVVGALLVRRQNSLSLPMLPVYMFKRPLFALSVATSACSSVAQGSSSCWQPGSRRSRQFSVSCGCSV